MLDIVRDYEYNYSVTVLVFGFVMEVYDERVCYSRGTGRAVECVDTPSSNTLPKREDRKRFKVWRCMGYPGGHSETNANGG
jgi:hypothetical protein